MGDISSLSGRMASDDVLLFEANMLLSNDLINEMQDQQNTYEIIRRYSRQKVKDEIVAVQKIFTSAPQYQGFMQRIANLFRKD